MVYLFNEAEYFLFDGAVNFGHLILQSTFATDQQKSEIEQFQAVLRSLPCSCENFEGGYSVSINSYDPDFVGINRSFSVWLDQKEGLGIQSLHTILPARDEDKEREHENFILFRPGFRQDLSWKECRRWVHDANMCFTFAGEKHEIEVETSFRVIDPTARMIRIQPDGQDYLWGDKGLVGIEEIAENLPHNLDQDFIEWSCSLENHWPNFEDEFWTHFHMRGIRLGKQLKNYLRKGVTLVYRRTPDDYNYREQEYYEI